MGRSLPWATFDAVPSGGSFSRRLGARAARLKHTSELRLADIDWAMIDDWILAPQARKRGYRLEMIEGAFPEDLRSDASDEPAIVADNDQRARETLQSLDTAPWPNGKSMQRRD